MELQIVVKFQCIMDGGIWFKPTRTPAPGFALLVRLKTPDDFKHPGKGP